MILIHALVIAFFGPATVGPSPSSSPCGSGDNGQVSSVRDKALTPGKSRIQRDICLSERHHYTLNGLQGEIFVVSLEAADARRLGLTVVGPDGQGIATTESERKGARQLRFQITKSGVHTLRISGRVFGKTTYTFGASRQPARSQPSQKVRQATHRLDFLMD